MSGDQGTPSVSPVIMHVVEAGEGGLRRHVVDLVDGLAALGWKQTVAYSPSRADGGMLSAITRWRSERVTVLELPMVRRLDPVQDFRAISQLIREARRFDVDILHLHSSKAGGVGRLAALLLPNVRTVYTPNASAIHLSSVYHAIEGFLGHLRTDALIAVSDSELRELRAARVISRKRLHCIPSGIDLDRVGRAVPDRRGALGPVVLTCGRITAQKAPLFMAEVSARVLAEVPEAKFVWAGDGEMRDEFEALLDKLGVGDRWEITGWLEDPFPAIAGCDIFALGSLYESFGYVTLEAMAVGRPVVVTAVAGSIDLVEDGRTGCVVPPGDVKDFASSIVRLLKDPALAGQMGQHGRERAKSYSRDSMALGVDRLYRSLIA